MTLNTIIVIIAIIETEVSVIRFNKVYAYLLWSITHVPSGAALYWRRSPTETSDRAVSVSILHPASHGVTQEQRRFLVKGKGHYCLGGCGALIGLEFLLMDLIVLSEKEIACC